MRSVGKRAGLNWSTFTCASFAVVVDIAACSHTARLHQGSVESMLRDPRVATVKDNALVFQACFGQLARKTGKAFHKGAT